MDEFEAVVMQLGRITIPASIREKQGIEEGDIVLVKVERIGRIVRMIEKNQEV
jgi:AbrB family looped-hinge helix DNA binding protein